MSEILQGLNGVVCLVDDILVYGNTQEQHDGSPPENPRIRVNTQQGQM